MKMELCSDGNTSHQLCRMALKMRWSTLRMRDEDSQTRLLHAVECKFKMPSFSFPTNLLTVCFRQWAVSSTIALVLKHPFPVHASRDLGHQINKSGEVACPWLFGNRSSYWSGNTLLMSRTYSNSHQPRYYMTTLSTRPTYSHHNGLR